jgi:myosin heavy subunit
MIESKPSGILLLLDEECFFPKATDITFVEKMQGTHAAHPNYISKKKKRTPSEFAILHFAGEVTYEAAGFLEKNRDTVSNGQGLII